MELRPLVPKPTIPKRETQRRLDFLRERERERKKKEAEEEEEEKRRRRRRRVMFCGSRKQNLVHG